MERLALDVIIPVRDRSTVVDCVTTLREQASQARGFVLGRILLCDGGSREADCRSQLAQVNQWPGVEVLHCGSAFDFNKGWLLNQGIAAATAPLILISDVDILWNTESLEALAIAATSHPHQINAIQSVVESRPQDGAVQRPRYGYRIEAQGEGFRVEVYAVDSAAASSGAASAGAMRPGCGLICARRSRFQDLGGYGHGFRGWGWEDQDFLMRAQLSGCAVGQLGWVMHLSHGDGLRNRFAGEQMPQASRDQNIRRCLAGLAQGRLLGDLPGASQAVGPGQGLPISVVAPPELADFFSFNPGLMDGYKSEFAHPLSRSLPHLTTQLAWWQQSPPALKQSLDWIVVEVTPTPSPGLAQRLRQHRVTYLHLACAGPFHKTRALNLALNQAQGEYIAAFDVDLIPLGQTLLRHRQLAAQSPQLLVTGYRLMVAQATVDPAALDDPGTLASLLAGAALGPEDQPSALRKHLLHGERFGVMPLFRRDRLLKVGGWDETFVGWGAEDQELIERYLGREQALCRCPDLTYLHLHHGAAEHWNSPQLTAQNRAHYYGLQNAALWASEH